MGNKNKNPILLLMNQPSEPNETKSRIIRFIIYLVVAFLFAYLYRQWRD
jgi:hypothetical protein